MNKTTGNWRLIITTVIFACQFSFCLAAARLTVGAAPQTIRKIVFDAQDNLWFGSFGFGLWKYNNGRPASFTAQTGESIFPMINNMLIEGDNLWLATAGKGVQCISIKNGKLLNINQADGHMKLHGLYRLSDGTLLAGSVGSGTSFLKDDTWLPIESDQPVHLSWVNDFIEWNGQLWLATSTGLYAQTLPLNKWKPAAKGINRPANCFLATEKNLFIGTTRGLHRMTRDGQITSERNINGTIHALVSVKNCVYAFGENGAWKICDAEITELPDFPDNVKCAAVNSKNCLFFATTDGRIFKSDDGITMESVLEFAGTGFEESN